jgi:ribosomal protein S27AE
VKSEEEKERDRQRARKYRAEHPTANAEQKRRRREEHPELVREENRRYRERNREKVNKWPSYVYRDRLKDYARRLVQQAILRGELIKKPCEECGEDNFAIVEAHHEDHALPLEVRWLCIKCHAKLHPMKGKQ